MADDNSARTRRMNGAPPARRARPESWVAGIAAGLCVIGILASFTLVSRLGYASSLAPHDLMAVRFATSGALLLPFALRDGLATLLRVNSLKLAVTGGLGFAALAFHGLALVPASHAGALLHGALPLFTFLIGSLLGGGRPGARRVVGAGLVLIAVAIIARDGLRGAGPHQFWGGVLLLSASATWSSFGILTARLRLEPIRAASTVAVLSAAAYMPAYLLFFEWGLADVPAKAVLLQVIVQGVLVGTLSVFAYSWAVARIGPIGAAVCTALVPAVTVLAAIPLLLEHPDLPMVLALAALALGSLLLVLRATG
jgi:drug/metabolite transporter (DMT)-like permease